MPWLHVTMGVIFVLASLDRLRITRLRKRERKLFQTIRRRYAQLRQLHALLEAHNQRLAKQASTDPLTGVNNRRYLFDALERMLRQAESSGSPTSVIMIDVDHFKSYNDDFGHLAGDEALRRLASLLDCSARPDDVVARYGGEEFVVVLPDTAASTAYELAESLRRAVDRLAGPLRRLTASFGVATAVAGPSQRLIGLADQALYNAKQAGRNRVSCSDASLSSAQIHRVEKFFERITPPKTPDSHQHRRPGCIHVRGQLHPEIC